MNHPKDLPPAPRRGRFVTFEGIDGAGKSTHVEWVADWLRERGLTAETTREPGGTELGERLRELLLQSAMGLDTEALLMFAARAEHLRTRILPALEQGCWVVSDRFTDASFAYQCGGRGLPRERLATLESWVQGGFQPDITFLFDLPLEVARQRIISHRQLDRFEREQADFHERVRLAYLDRARRSGERIKVIPADQPVDAIRTILAGHLEKLLP